MRWRINQECKRGSNQLKIDQIKLPFKPLFRCLALWTALTSSAFAIPTVKDEWRYFCPTQTVSKKVLGELSNKADEQSTEYGGGIAVLNYACAQSIMEQQSYKNALNAFKKKGGAGKEPAASTRASDALIKRAAESLASDYKSKKKNQKILYYYGLSLALLGNPLTVNIFDELTTKFAKGNLTPRSYLTLGNYYLDKQDVAKAQRELDAAVKTTEPAVQTYAKYKSAWIIFAVAYNQKDLNKQREAIEKFAGIFQGISDDEEQGEILKATIKQDLLDLLAAYGNVAESRKILRRIDAMAELPVLLEKMAETKIASGDIQGGYSLLSQVIKERPNHQDNLAVHTRMLYISGQTKNIPGILSTIKLMLQTYANPESTWAKEQEDEYRAIAAKKVEDLVFEFATSLDQEGSKANQQPLLQASVQLYQLFIKSFPKSPRIFEAEFYFAQLLAQLNKYQIAANLLRKLLLKNPKGKFAREASDGMIAAAQKAYELDKNDYTLPELGMAKRSIKLPESRQLFADSLDLYAKLRPKNPDVPVMYFTAATIYFEFGHYKKSNERYLKFIQSAPANESAPVAAVRILFTSKNQLGEEALAKAKDDISKFPQIKNHPDIAPFYLEQPSDGRAGKKAKVKQGSSTDAEVEENGDDLNSAEEQENSGS